MRENFLFYFHVAHSHTPWRDALRIRLYDIAACGCYSRTRSSRREYFEIWISDNIPNCFFTERPPSRPSERKFSTDSNTIRAKNVIHIARYYSTGVFLYIYIIRTICARRSDKSFYTKVLYDNDAIRIFWRVVIIDSSIYNGPGRNLTEPNSEGIYLCRWRGQGVSPGGRYFY